VNVDEDIWTRDRPPTRDKIYSTALSSQYQPDHREYGGLYAVRISQKLSYTQTTTFLWEMTDGNIWSKRAFARIFLYFSCIMVQFEAIRKSGKLLANFGATQG